MRNFVLLICFVYSVAVFSNQYGSIVFNELMIDPDPAVGLPEVEYIELYNRSAQSQSLNGWTLYYENKSFSLPDCSIDSSGYCVLCSKSGSIQFSSNIPVAAFTSFPTLSNSGKLLYLVADNGDLISCINYSNEWYNNAFKAKGGWSLECIDADNLSGLAANWAVSNDLMGGTPGRLNSVASKMPDKTLPLYAGINVPSSSQIKIEFSKHMNPGLLGSSLSYEVSPQTTLISMVTADYPDYRSVCLTLSDSLVRGNIYTLKIMGLTDISGLQFKDTIISFGLPETPAIFDLSLNELLFNPVSSGYDYVEFVNRSDKCIDLSQVWITNKSESGALNEGVRLTDKHIPCMPGSYWLLSENTDTVCVVNGCSKATTALNIASFPSMPDASGTIVLLTSSAEIIDEVSYQESMHFPLINNREGVSLEKINPDLSSSNTESWCSASSASGYGTPGFRNSQYEALNSDIEPGFSVDNRWLAPNNDGKNDYLTIYYDVCESCMANLIIYDLNGRVVKSLAKNQLLGSKGSFIWDGTSDSGKLLPFGRYILQTEYFNTSGKRILKRFVLAVLF